MKMLLQNPSPNTSLPLTKLIDLDGDNVAGNKNDEFRKKYGLSEQRLQAAVDLLNCSRDTAIENIDINQLANDPNQLSAIAYVCHKAATIHAALKRPELASQSSVFAHRLKEKANKLRCQDFLQEPHRIVVSQDDILHAMQQENGDLKNNGYDLNALRNMMRFQASVLERIVHEILRVNPEEAKNPSALELYIPEQNWFDAYQQCIASNSESTVNASTRHAHDIGANLMLSNISKSANELSFTVKSAWEDHAWIPREIKYFDKTGKPALEMQIKNGSQYHFSIVRKTGQSLACASASEIKDMELKFTELPFSLLTKAGSAKLSWVRETMDDETGWSIFYTKAKILPLVSGGSVAFVSPQGMIFDDNAFKKQIETDLSETIKRVIEQLKRLSSDSAKQAVLALEKARDTTTPEMANQLEVVFQESFPEIAPELRHQGVMSIKLFHRLPEWLLLAKSLEKNTCFEAKG